MGIYIIDYYGTVSKRPMDHSAHTYDDYNDALVVGEMTKHSNKHVLSFTVRLMEDSEAVPEHYGVVKEATPPPIDPDFERCEPGVDEGPPLVFALQSTALPPHIQPRRAPQQAGGYDAMREGYQPKDEGPIGPPPTGGSSVRYPADVARRHQDTPHEAPPPPPFVAAAPPRVDPRWRAAYDNTVAIIHGIQMRIVTAKRLREEFGHAGIMPHEDGEQQYDTATEYYDIQYPTDLGTLQQCADYIKMIAREHPECVDRNHKRWLSALVSYINTASN